jgi:ER membrane protein complex subunit 3
MGDLLLDERMIGWVFIPIIYVTCIIQLFRLYYNLYNNFTKTKKAVKRAQYGDTKDKQLVEKCDHLAKKYYLLSREAFDCRRGFLCRPEKGYLVVNGDRPPVDSMNSMQSMQNGMMDNMKGMLVMMGTTIPAMAWINSFFAGFVLAKVPFSMTQQFRSLTQSGIDMANLDVSYVSSVSFYFLIVFGLNQLQSLLFDDEEDEDSMKVINEDRKQMAGGMNPMAQQGGMMGAANQSSERKQIFKPQIDGLELISHNFIFAKSNRDALNRLNDFLSE